MYQYLSILFTLFLAMQCYSASSDQNDPFNDPFYDNLTASLKRAHYLKQQLPNHNFFKDLDAYLTFVSDITGLGVIHDGSDKVHTSMFAKFGEKIISDQFDPRVCAYLLQSQSNSDHTLDYSLDEFVFSLLTKVVPDTLFMSLNRLQKTYLERKEQKALVLFAEHIREIMAVLHPKCQFILWRDSIKDDPDFFNEYIEHTKLVKRVSPNLNRLHEKLHDALKHSLLLECLMEDLVYEVISASIGQS